MQSQKTQPDPEEETGRYLGTAEVACALSVSRNAVLNWIRAGKLQAIQLPSGLFRIPVSELERIMTPVSAESPGDGEVSLW